MEIETKVQRLGDSPSGVSIIGNIENVAALRAIITTFLSTGTIAKLADGTEYYFNAIAETGGISPDTGNGKWYLLAPYGGGVNVKSFGVVGDGITDDSDAIQNALDSGSDLFFPKGTYACVGLVMDTAQQTIYGNGGYSTRLVKNADGVVLTVTGNACKLRGLTFAGEDDIPVFTGNNVDVIADEVELTACNSYKAFGLALSVKGSHCLVMGGRYSSNINSYDISVGENGVAHLYTNLLAIYTEQPTGGIIATDTGNLKVCNSQFGKLTIVAGTSPAGSNGGEIIGNRILGDVSVGLSNTLLTGNHFGVVNVTFAVGTSNCKLGLSNTLDVGSTVTNNGNRNNLIVREVSAGGYNDIKVGDDVSNSVMRFGDNEIYSLGSDFFISNNLNLFFKKADDTNGASMGLTAAGDFGMSVLGADNTATFGTTGASSRFQFFVDGVAKLYMSAGGVFLGADNNGSMDTQGAGSPEGVITAKIGSIYRRTDGGAGTCLYIKESGAGNTGWVAK